MSEKIVDGILCGERSSAWLGKIDGTTQNVLTIDLTKKFIINDKTNDYMKER